MFPEKVPVSLPPLYSFCETVTATAISYWHIRKLTEKGQKFGGGADTKALCGKEVSWDLRVRFDAHCGADYCCPECFEIYEVMERENV
jgi:hypothetical protein